MTDKIYHVLFLCTGNSARSIMAEAYLNARGKGRFKAFSAGSHPTGVVNPLALETLRGMGLTTDGLRSKAWDEFAGPTAPALDFVFTVCDKAAGEACPIWPGQPMTAHWGADDPAAVTGSDAVRLRAFERVGLELGRRIDLFLSLPLASLDTMALQRRLRDIGKS